MEPQKMSHWPAWSLPVLGREVSESEPHPCSYFPERLARFRAFQAHNVGAEEYQDYMDAGFRRSGRIVYQPICDGCRQCVPLRVDVAKFQMARSQRRILRKNQDVHVRIAIPQVTAEKWRLYERYQREWHDGQQAGDPMAFISFLYQSPVETAEFEYRDTAGKLLGCGICDVSKKSVSSVYFYFDPEESRRSPGTFSALYEILWAREMQIPYWYAGYWIEGCGRMEYKSRFRPCEILSTDSTWREMK